MSGKYTTADGIKAAMNVYNLGDAVIVLFCEEQLCSTVSAVA